MISDPHSRISFIIGDDLFWLIFWRIFQPSNDHRCDKSCSYVAGGCSCLPEHVCPRQTFLMKKSLPPCPPIVHGCRWKPHPSCLCFLHWTWYRYLSDRVVYVSKTSDAAYMSSQALSAFLLRYPCPTLRDDEGVASTSTSMQRHIKLCLEGMSPVPCRRCTR